MSGITRFEDINTWQTARELTNAVYKLTGQLEFSRDFGLRDQIRRAVVSVMSNIAEGFESRTDVQFINYLGLARSSAGESRAQLISHSIRDTSALTSSRKHIPWLKNAPGKSQTLSSTWKHILALDVLLRNRQVTIVTSQKRHSTSQFDL